jgi:hypothetical protein
VEEGELAQPGVTLDYSPLDDILAEAVARRLALRLSYGVTAQTGFDIRITQGPAEDLRLLLRGTPRVPWSASEPIRLSVAGREVEGWYGAGERTYLIVELGPTLLVIDTPRPPDDPELLALLAGLSPAQ